VTVARDIRTVAAGADHAGFEYKQKIVELLRAMGIEVIDLGAASADSVDYPDFAHSVAEAVASGRAQAGVLVCGSGIGMSIVANKHAGVRAANVESVEAARLSREHNDANVLALGARLTTWDKAKEILLAFLGAEFQGGRHQKRVDKIHDLTNL
jgi:ribose 5-phosphate isomerase B